MKAEKIRFQVSLENCQGLSNPDEGGKFKVRYEWKERDRSVAICE